MRNLKKFLALMLAMVMAMSLMITANATSTAEDFADGAGITPEFAEAVDVLSGMRVFSGDNGNFKPAANITRAEMAAVLYRLVSGDVTDAKAGLYANYAPFKDVTADKWYAGYVGYCWNMGLIKGRDSANTVFDPTGNVTGYEALAMLLRAVGYDKNNEFTGATWQTNVSTTGQQLGILRDISTTQYGGTLHLAARRDVIASMTFRTAAFVPTVTYSAAMGYNPYVGVPVTGATGTAEHNPTLGWKAFGLTNDTGIVVGNQDTGESVTRVSFSIETADPVYAYGIENMNNGLVDDTTPPAVPGDDVQANVIATFDAKTDLGLFAHKVEFWFDGRNTELKPAYFGQDVALDWRNSKQNNNLHTYAYFDRASHTSLVKMDPTADNYALTVNTPSTANTLGAKAAAAGFTVNASTSVEQNLFFDRFLHTDNAKVQTVTMTAPNTGDSAGFTENLYLLISNSDNKALDVVIALNIQVSEITGVDNVNAVKTVTMPQETTTPAFVHATNEISSVTTKVPHPATVEQGQLVPGSTTTLGQYEIGVRINGTSDDATATLPTSAIVDDAAGTNSLASGSGTAIGYHPKHNTLVENAWFKLVPVTNTKEGQVVSYNPDTGVINLQDGTVLERSILYNSVVANTIPQVGATENGRPATGGDYYQSGTYRFYLTPDGKYLGAELTYSNSFIYGTYMDYSTVTSSSTFNYFLTGVNLAGEKVTVPVSRLGVDTGVTTVGGAINGTDQLGVPYRDTYNNTGNGQGVNGVGNGVYRGFAYNGSNTVNWTYTALSQIGIIAGDNGVGATWANNDWQDFGPVANAAAPSVAFDNVDRDDGDGGVNDTDHGAINIGSRQMALGAVYAGTISLNGVDSELLYFTENTKFILVDGFGEDSLTPTVYNGITDLVTKGGHISATIDLDQAAPTWADRDANNVIMSDMTYLTQSPFVYSQNRVLSRQADVIFLPVDAVDWDDSTTTRYVGNATRTLVNVNANATQFTMYNNGVAESVWVSGMIDDGTSSAWKIDQNSHDHFYRLEKTDRSISGTPIYNVTLINEGWAQNIYTASTMNAQTGSFECTISGNSRTVGEISLMRVANANITNLNVLNAAPTWPGINSLATLNDAGSLGNYGDQHGGNQDLYVSAITDSSTNVTQIYVCYDQTPTGAGTQA